MTETMAEWFAEALGGVVVDVGFGEYDVDVDGKTFKTAKEAFRELLRVAKAGEMKDPSE